MARPTNDPKTRMIRVRINEDVAREIERRSNGNMSMAIREIIERGLGDNVPQNRELKNMADFWGVSTEDLINDFVLLLSDGTIEMRDGILWVEKCPFRYEEFVERCRESGVDPQKAIDKFTRMI